MFGGGIGGNPDDELYKSGDPVVILTDVNFHADDSGRIVIPQTHFKGPGALKAYATWCPHCKNKVECIKTLATILNNEGLALYVVESRNEAFMNAMKVQGLPSFFEVTADRRVVPKPMTLNGEPVHTVPDIIGSLCETDGTASICSRKSTFSCTPATPAQVGGSRSRQRIVKKKTRIQQEGGCGSCPDRNTMLQNGGRRF